MLRTVRTSETRKRIRLLIPCYVDMLFPEADVATLELLERLGYDVGYPPGHSLDFERHAKQAHWNATSLNNEDD